MTEELINEEEGEEDQKEKELKEIEKLRDRLDELQNSIKTITNQISKVGIRNMFMDWIKITKLSPTHRIGSCNSVHKLN